MFPPGSLRLRALETRLITQIVWGGENANKAIRRSKFLPLNLPPKLKIYGEENRNESEKSWRKMKASPDDSARKLFRQRDFWLISPHSQQKSAANLQQFNVKHLRETWGIGKPCQNTFCFRLPPYDWFRLLLVHYFSNNKNSFSSTMWSKLRAFCLNCFVFVFCLNCFVFVRRINVVHDNGWYMPSLEKATPGGWHCFERRFYDNQKHWNVKVEHERALKSASRCFSSISIIGCSWNEAKTLRN